MTHANAIPSLRLALGAAALSLCLAGPQTAAAADGDLDPAFGTGGKVMTDFNNSTDIAYAVAVQQDGKYVVVGTTYTNNDYTCDDFALARHHPHGTLDTRFRAQSNVKTD